MCERGGDLAAGVRRVDHGIDVSTLGRHVRIEQPLGVVGLEGRPLVGCGPPLEDRRGLAGAHHGELRPGPGQAQVVAHGLGVHHDERAAVALAQDHADSRHGGAGVGEHQLGAVADHPAPFEILAGVEARRVDERDDRQIERVAERDEAGGLLRTGDVEGAGERHRLVGDDADRPPVDGREGGDRVGRPPVAQLEEAALVDDRFSDLAHVVAARRGRRHQIARFGARPVGRVVVRPAFRLDVDVVGEIGQERLGRLDRSVAIGDDHRRHAGVAGEVRRATQLVDVDPDAGELLDHDRAR